MSIEHDAEMVVRDHNHRHSLEAQRPGWDAYFLNIAQAIAWRADCRRAKFGAVIVDQDRRIVSTGYNGAPPKEGSCLAGDCSRGLLTRDQQPSHADGGHGAQDFSNCISLHAEMNAIAYAGHTPGGTIYIAALDRDHCVPCDMCSKLIRAAGITRIVCQ